MFKYFYSDIIKPNKKIAFSPRGNSFDNVYFFRLNSHIKAWCSIRIFFKLVN